MQKNAAAAPAHKRKNLLFTIVVIALVVAILGFLCSAVFTYFSHKSQAIGIDAATKFANGFSCTADVTWNGSQYEVKLQSGSSSTVMTFIKPENLKSLSFEDGAQGLKVKFGTLEAAVDASSIPQTSLFSAVTGAIESSANPDASVSREGKSYVVSGNSTAGKYKLVLDENMAPQSLSIPSLKLNVTFKSFTFNKVASTAADAEQANGP